MPKPKVAPTVRQQYVWIDIQFEFPDPDRAPAIDRAAFTGIALAKIPRTVALVAGLEIEYLDRLWLVAKVRCSAKPATHQKGNVPLVTLQYIQIEEKP